MAIQLKTLTPITFTSGVRVPASTDHIAVTSLTIQADDDNTGNIYVGDVTVTAATGLELIGGNTCEITGDQVGRGGAEEFFLDEVFLISSTTGAQAELACFRRKP